MEFPVARIENSEAITSVFGYWPSFHDAEVLELVICRDGSGPGRASVVARVHVFEMTSQVKPDGHYLCHKHSIVSLVFEDVDELVMEGFNHQNALAGLRIEEREPGGCLAVAFDGAYGLEASLICRSIRVDSIALGIPAGSVYSAEKA